MPEVSFSLRWPDGSQQACLSPSRTIERALTPGASYPVDELVRRCSEALHAGSDRLRSLRGFGCAAALATVEAIAERGRGQTGRVLVESVRRDPGPSRFPAPARLDGHVPCVVIGGGQAGLAVSHELEAHRIEHVVLERDRIAHAWRDERWESFCLVTPNWQCRLPGFPYAGDEPDGFMPRDEIVGYLEAFAASFAPPIHEGVAVTAVEAGERSRFVVHTSHGTIACEQIVLAVGGYHRPRVSPLAASFPSPVSQLHSSTYRVPEALPDGPVLVVGSGQSGAQIAEDLHLAGREVHLAVGSAPRVARAHRGRDVVAWLEDMGHYDLPIDEHPEGVGARLEANHYVTGRGGGRDIDLRAFAAGGMRLHGRLLAVENGTARLSGDLRANLDAADATKLRIEEGIDRWIAEHGVQAPPAEVYLPVWEPAEDVGSTLALDDLGAVVWATGFVSDWSWVHLPAFDGSGYPVHERGVTSVEGLHVLGLPWLHTWGSGRFAAIARDAAHLAEAVATRHPAARAAA